MLISVFIIKLSPKCGVSGNWRAVFYVVGYERNGRSVIPRVRERAGYESKKRGVIPQVKVLAGYERKS